MYTLIIADDEYELRQALIRTVDWESIGFQVVGEAENGVEALELVEKLKPDLLLTDIKMPFLSGIELAREVRAVSPAMNIAFLSGYDDFAYAQQAIQYNIISYILKPVSASELKEEMIKIRDKMDERVEAFTRYNSTETMERFQEEQDKRTFLYALLLAERSEESKIWKHDMEQAGLRTDIFKNGMRNTHFLIQVAEFYDNEGNNKTAISHINRINTIIEKYVRCISIFSNQRIITLAAEGERNLRRYMALFPKEISQSAERFLDEKAVIGISNVYEDVFDTHLGYLEALEAQEYAENEEEGISFLSDYEAVNTREQLHIRSTVDELIRIMKTESEEELVDYLEKVFSNQDISSGLISSQMMVSIYETINNLVGEAVADKLFLENIAVDAQLERLVKKHSKTELTSLALAARNLILEKRKANTELICDDVMKIITEEYGDEQLQLQQISERLHVSVSYLSTLIKKVSGKSFVTLLTEKRMEAAKEQLLYSPKKILEIAMDCGYSDNHYFSYSFKKYFGVSPKKMRENIQNEEK